MLWKDASFTPRRKNEGGFTFIEVLASLLLLAILGIGAWQAGIVGTRVLSSAAGRSSRAAHLLRLDEIFRREMSRVRIPYWISQIEIDSSIHQIEIPYVDGSPDSQFIISIREKALYLHSPDTGVERAFGPFEEIGIELVHDSHMNPIGVRIRAGVQKSTSKPNVMAFRFGSNPLWSSHE